MPWREVAAGACLFALLSAAGCQRRRQGGMAATESGARVSGEAARPPGQTDAGLPLSPAQRALRSATGRADFPAFEALESALMADERFTRKLSANADGEELRFSWRYGRLGILGWREKDENFMSVDLVYMSGGELRHFWTVEMRKEGDDWSVGEITMDTCVD